jgi:glycosyltransferase involved in cell wall biosynthesis
MPDEVIVVDNNCTDRTLEIAESYKFVSIIREKSQGHAPPRNRGFNKAKSDIIGRIDADSVLMPGWVERVRERFQDEDIAGITGLGRTDVMTRISRPSIKTTFWTRVYYWNVHAYFNTVTTWGANMAIRRDWWYKVKNDVRKDDTITHEDQDVALLIAARGGRVVQDNKLLITTTGQTYTYAPKMLHYIRLKTLTRNHHRSIGTFESPDFVGIGFWRTFPGRVGAVLPGMIFGLVSLLLWPVDEFMIRSGRRAKWIK